MPTANMGITLPIDHGSADQWDVILDTVFALVDSHDHSTGKGVAIPANALNINGDVSWSSGGTSHSIADLLALDFKPSPAANVTGLAAALFVSDGTSGLSANELYWRTTTGTNVKMTAGAALNVAAFTGGIGGDYAATGALVVFDDASDSYWFQQQVGAAVRQYARMRSADVDLYEYKANPTAGVPTNRVRLASPTALAASYALTLPAALPASTKPLQLDSTGIVSVVAGVPRLYSIALAAPNTSAGQTMSDLGFPALGLQGSTAVGWLPLWMAQGETISAWQVQLNKASASGTISAKLMDMNVLAGTVSQIGATQSNGAVSPGNIQLGQSGLATTVTAGHTYLITIAGGGTTGDFVFGYSVTPG